MSGTSPVRSCGALRTGVCLVLAAPLGLAASRWAGLRQRGRAIAAGLLTLGPLALALLAGSIYVQTGIGAAVGLSREATFAWLQHAVAVTRTLTLSGAGLSVLALCIVAVRLLRSPEV